MRPHSMPRLFVLIGLSIYYGMVRARESPPGQPFYALVWSISQDLLGMSQHGLHPGASLHVSIIKE